MPTYDYFCKKCEMTTEIAHSIHKDPKLKCKKCHTKLIRIISISSHIIESGIKQKAEDYKEDEHKKKVKDIERAARARRKLFGSEAGQPKDKPDPKHIIKRGKTIAGQNIEIDKSDFIKAAARDPYLVTKAQEIAQKKA